MTDSPLKKLLSNNAEWAARIKRDDPDFFTKLSGQQAPEYLWIGCSDSRVPANQIIGLLPGEVFVHRNLANLVLQSDFNCLSVLQFAVEILRVKHIIVCGHYGCGGIHASLHNRKLGLADNWLRPVQDAYARRRALFDGLDDARRWDLLCETNVIDQVRSVARTTVVQDAWARGQALSIHGWVYGLQDGLMRELITDAASQETLEQKHQSAIEICVAKIRGQ